MRQPIGKPLANDAAKSASRALDIVDAERDPLIVPKIELREISLQVLLADMVVHTIDAALED